LRSGCGRGSSFGSFAWALVWLLLVRAGRGSRIAELDPDSMVHP